MKITQSEVIQILRRRANMTQGELGVKAFNTSYESGRAKVRNIELGKQIPTARDMTLLARQFGIPPKDLILDEQGSVEWDTVVPDGAIVDRDVLDLFPGLEDYIQMLNKAAILKDQELAYHIAERVSALLLSSHERDAAGG